MVHSVFRKPADVSSKDAKEFFMHANFLRVMHKNGRDMEKNGRDMKKNAGNHDQGWRKETFFCCVLGFFFFLLSFWRGQHPEGREAVL